MVLVVVAGVALAFGRTHLLLSEAVAIFHQALRFLALAGGKLLRDRLCRLLYRSYRNRWQGNNLLGRNLRNHKSIFLRILYHHFHQPIRRVLTEGQRGAFLLQVQRNLAVGCARCACHAKCCARNWTPGFFRASTHIVRVCELLGLLSFPDTLVEHIGRVHLPPHFVGHVRL